MLAACWASLSFAQVDFGVKAGPNLSTWIIYGQANPSLLGYNVGLVARIPVSQRFFVGSGVVFNTRGTAHYDLDVERLSYLSIPVQIGFKIGRRLQIMAGTDFGFLLAAVNKDIYANGGMNISPFFRTVDVGFDGSVRYGFTKNLGIDFSYIRSLQGILKPNQPFVNNPQGTATDPGTTTPVYVKDNFVNSSFQMGIYYFFNK
jgi:hypothetical protein